MTVRMVGIALLVAVASCGREPEPSLTLPADPPSTATKRDEPPVALDASPPVMYPDGPASQRIGGTVMLRLFADSAGRIVAESTALYESSGYPALDSAALDAAGKLRFAPGLRDGNPTATRFLQPFNFRAPATGGPVP
ncbi:MAG: TonB family protein [Gemmatimonadales bacterium]